MNDVNNLSKPAEASNVSDSSQILQPSSTTSHSGESVADKEAEIETLSGELEKKLEDLQELVSNPRLFLTDIHATKRASAVMSSLQIGEASGCESAKSPTVSTAQTNVNSGLVTDLGVLGRGV